MSDNLFNSLDEIYLTTEYNKYLDMHINGVTRAYNWLVENLPDVIKDTSIEYNILHHDASKYSEEEFMPYARYFYGHTKTDKIKKDFDYAWLHHIHNNPHHWQYWLLQNDEDGFVKLEIPYQYIIEMICDWWAFSFVKGDLTEIFKWYESHKDKIIINDKSRKTLEGILDKIKAKLAKVEKKEE